MLKRTEEIAWPEDDPEFVALREQQRRAHEEIRKNSEIVQAYKNHVAAREGLVGAQLRTGPNLEETARAKEASRAVRAAQATLRDLELPMREARSAAVRKIVADVKPEYLKRIGAFALAYLKARADELAAIEAVFALRAELNQRQVGMSTLPIPPFERSYERTEWHYQVIREDTLELIRLGALKAADLPAKLREAWRIK